MYINRYLSVLTVIAYLCMYSVVNAQNSDHPDIIEHLTTDSATIIIIPDGLKERLKYDENATTDKQDNRQIKGKIGYRVQVFSDNNSRTAKNEARIKERRVQARFPQYRSYVMFKAPYWRLRVGDFKTQQEANNAAEEIKRAFPSYSKEIRVVQDKIN